MIKCYNFGPRNESEEIVFAEEGFLVDVQVTIHELMLKHRVSKKKLAEKLGITTHELNRFFTGDHDLTVREVGRIFHALGLEPELKAK